MLAPCVLLLSDEGSGGRGRGGEVGGGWVRRAERWGVDEEGGWDRRGGGEEMRGKDGGGAGEMRRGWGGEGMEQRRAGSTNTSQ